MTDRFIKKEFGYHQLNGPLLSLLQNTVKSERGADTARDKEITRTGPGGNVASV